MFVTLTYFGSSHTFLLEQESNIADFLKSKRIKRKNGSEVGVKLTFLANPEPKEPFNLTQII